MRHSSFLEVNLGLLADNFTNIQALAPRAKILPMVKADAYGNGLLPISKFLVNELSVKTLGCASLGEAIALGEDVNSNIVVFSDTELSNENLRRVYSDSTFIPVIHHVRDLEIILKDMSMKSVPLYLKLNTGMNRLGLSQKDLEPYLPALKNRGIDHLMTHFSRSGQVTKKDDKTHKQFEEFNSVKKFLLDSGVQVEATSVANSGAIEQKFGIDETYIRPGLMMYGPASVESPTLWKGHQISRFVTKILSTFQVKKGTPIGYGVNVADKDSLIAVLPVGYGDGLIAYGTGTRLTVNGVETKIFGRINMDMTFLQFDPKDEEKIRIGDAVELWNHDNRIIADIATQNKTIPYQLMCGISARIPRIYKRK